MALAPVVAIVGRANVGKSTLFNRLVGGRIAITDAAAGTTRDSVYGQAEWQNRHYRLIDTAGVAPPEDELEDKVQEQINQVANLADLLVVVVDASGIITSEDRQAAKKALKTGQPVILAVNKADQAKHLDLNAWRALGIPQMSAVSAIHGRGTGDLMDLIATHTKTSRVAPTSPNLRLTILGRPNVGKSSLFNALAGQRQAIVSAQAGTTRDTGRIELKYHGQTVELTDTAGLRKRGRIVPGIEKFSTLRTASAASGADICLVVMDALEPGVAGDQHIAGLVASGGQGLILVVNKWDAVDKDDKTQARTLRRLQHDFQFVWWAPLVFTSATEGHNVPKILELATEIKARREVKIPTPKLNRTLQQLVTAQPPAGLKNRHPKLNYVTQTGVNPPTFTIFGAQTDGLHFSYRRYLENGLRSTYDLTGTPIKFEFRDKRNLSLRGAK